MIVRFTPLGLLAYRLRSTVWLCVSSSLSQSLAAHQHARTAYTTTFVPGQNADLVDSRDQTASRQRSTPSEPAMHSSKSFASSSTESTSFRHEDFQGLRASGKLSLRWVANLIDENAPSSATRSAGQLLSSIRRMQQAQGVCIDIDDPGSQTEAKLKASLSSARSLLRLSAFVAPGQHIAGSDDSLDVVVSICLAQIGEPHSFDDFEYVQLRRLASSCLEKAHYRSLRAIASLLEPLIHRQYLSALPDLNLNTDVWTAYTTAMSAHVTACNWDIVWKKRKLLLFVAKHTSATKGQINTRPDMMVLRAAACKDLTFGRSTRDSNKEVIYARQRFERLRSLYQDAIDLGLQPDKRWAALLVSGLMRNATNATFNGGVRALATSFQLPQLLDTQQAFLEGLLEICKSEEGQEAVVFSILEAEVHVVSALLSDEQPKDTKLIARLREHLHAVIQAADKLAESFPTSRSTDKRTASQRHQIFWLQSARASVMKASHALLRLHLFMGDVDAAFLTLDTMLQRIAQSSKETASVRTATSTILHREQRNKKVARSGMINILLKLSNDDVSEQVVRKQMLKLMEYLSSSLESGIFDVAIQDADTVQLLSLSVKNSPAFDLARACTRLMGAMSPAQSRTYVARKGARYVSSAENAAAWKADYLYLLELIAKLRARAVERGQESSAHSGTANEVVSQPWRSAFKNQMDDEPLRIARIIWSLTATWQPLTIRLSAEDKETDPEYTEKIKVLGDEFCRNLQWLVDRILLEFGVAPRTWRVTYDALRRHRRHLPTYAARKEAVQIFKRGMLQAGVLQQPE